MSTVAEEQVVTVSDAPDRERVRKSIIGSIGSALRKHPWLEWLIPAARCVI
jgi:predicted transcriptional regulator of viral defense system